MQKMHPNVREFPNRDSRLWSQSDELAPSQAPLTHLQRHPISNGVRRANAKVIPGSRKGSDGNMNRIQSRFEADLKADG